MTDTIFFSVGLTEVEAKQVYRAVRLAEQSHLLHIKPGASLLAKVAELGDKLKYAPPVDYSQEFTLEWVKP